MKKRAAGIKYTPPTPVEAVYADLSNPMWKDNPLICALPVLQDVVTFIERIQVRPEHDNSMRLASDEERIGYVGQVTRFFLPNEQHIQLNYRIYRALCEGYVNRNPIEDRAWKKLNVSIGQAVQDFQYQLTPHKPQIALGFKLSGIGGTGKTNGVDAILRQYPQVLIHHQFQGESLNYLQIVWLKINCPEESSLGAMCEDVFEQLGYLVGQDYKGMYGGQSVAKMIPHLARLAALHHLGMLIIDESQNISSAGIGRKGILAFFTRLINMIQLPVILIGTPKADETLSGALHQIRRNSGQGEIFWKRMHQGEDGNFANFAKELWRIQFTRTHTPLSPELENTLYQESQGIADFAVKLYMISQERAIQSGLEEISTALIQQVAIDAFSTARAVLQKLGANDLTIYDLVDDVVFDLNVVRGLPSQPTRRKKRNKAQQNPPPQPKNPNMAPQKAREENQAARVYTLPIGYEQIRQEGFIRDYHELQLEG
jgi:hypothetical protein